METVIRAVVMYAVLMVIIRLSGRRTLAQMTVFDLVIVLVVSETAQQALVGNDFSITNAVVVMITLFALDTKLDVPASTDAFETRANIMKAIQGHILGKAVYVGLFRRPQ